MRTTLSASIWVTDAVVPQYGWWFWLRSSTVPEPYQANEGGDFWEKTETQKFAGNLVNYGIIQDRHLPDVVRDELVNNCPGNDTGTIVNPDYHPFFQSWLVNENMPLKPYIIWWSW